MKRTFCILIAFIFLLPMLLLPTVHAENYDELCHTLAGSFASGDMVDISAFGLNEDALDAAFTDVWYSGRLPWYAFSYQYAITNGVVTSFAPVYYDQDSFDYELYEQTAQSIIHQVILPDMTQWEMALAVHDYLIVNSQYDETLEKNTNYDLLVNGTAVCSGYAMAYLDIMTRLGIECRFVESQAMTHAWNMVNIDGNWYHVDLTHDDPTPDSYGYVSHDHFLKTDAQMKKLGYHGWDNGISCTDETFSEPIWANCNSQVIFTEDAIYTRIKDNFNYTIYCTTDESEEPEAVAQITAKTLTLDGDAYHYENNGLTLWDGKLWFSTVDRVRCLSLDTASVQTIFRYDVDENQKFIYSSLVKDGMLHLTLSDGQYQFSTQTISLMDTDAHTHDYQETTLERTCTQAGGTIYLCSCGLSYNGALTKAFGHNYNSYISVPATCSQPGEKRYECIRCDDFYTESFEDSYAHDYESVVIAEATLRKDGMKQSTCKICNRTLTETIPRQTLEDITGLSPVILIIGLVMIISVPILFFKF